MKINIDDAFTLIISISLKSPAWRDFAPYATQEGYHVRDLTYTNENAIYEVDVDNFTDAAKIETFLATRGM